MAYRGKAGAGIFRQCIYAFSRDQNTIQLAGLYRSMFYELGKHYMFSKVDRSHVDPEKITKETLINTVISS